MRIRTRSAAVLLGASVQLFLSPLGSFGQAPAAPDICTSFNAIDIPDSAGDATSPSPPYVDILGLHLRQLGQYVRFEWEAAANPYNLDDQYFFIFFDTDRNAATGQQWGGIGAEASIVVAPYVYDTLAELAYWDDVGNLISEEVDLHVAFSDSGFVLLVELERIPSRHFDIYFESSGQPGWLDEGSVQEISLQPPTDSIEIRVDAPQLVLEDRLRLFNLPEAGGTLQLSTVAVRNGQEYPLAPSEVSYAVYHSRPGFVPDPLAVISVDGSGLATYESEGFVFANARVDACGLLSDSVVLATGDPYGAAGSDRVVAVFPSDYAADGSPYTFGDMMSGYPDTMRVLDLAYDMSSDLYGGYRPLNGETQVLALIVAEGLCGGPGNPMQTAPCCYMNCGDGTPQYEVIIHEMGHNFQELGGMAQLLWDNDGAICLSGFCECGASLPVIYLQHEIVENGAAYDIEPGSFEYDSFQDARAVYCPSSEQILEEFEQQIDAEVISGVFDPGVGNGVGVYCAFFEQFTCDFVEGPNPYRHEVVRRFLEVFGDRKLPGFVPEKVETYFGAVYSLAVGRDMRAKLRFWGFEIDDGYYDEITPLIELRLEQAERRISHESFETGELGDWVVGGGDDVEVHKGPFAYGGSFSAAITVAPCATEDELVLNEFTVFGVESFEACRRIRAGDGFVIADGGIVTFDAGASVVLENDFMVENGGRLTATLGPSLSPFAYLEDATPSSESSYSAEFFVNLDDLSIGSTDQIEHFVAYGDTGMSNLKVVLGSGPEMTLVVRDSGGAWQSAGSLGLGAGWNKVEIRWEAGVDASASLTLNDDTRAELTSLATAGLRISSIRWGAVAGTVDATTGTIRLDDFASWR